MKKTLHHHESFAPVSRGLISHMQYMSSNAVKLFLYILLKVRSVGDRKGYFCGYVSDCCEDLGWITKTWYKTIKEIDPYISYTAQSSRHKPFKIYVQRYKAIDDFYAIPDGNSNGNSNGTVTGKYRDSNGKVTSPNLREQSELGSCKKEKRRKGEKIRKELTSGSSPDCDKVDIEGENTAQYISSVLSTKLWRNISSYGTAQKKPDLKAWSKTFADWMRVDRRSGQWILELMKAARADDFWRPNLRSPDTIRKRLREGKLDRFVPTADKVPLDNSAFAEFLRKEEQRETE